jgi:phospholipase C
MCKAANCRRFPGSWRRPVIPNIRIGRINYGAWYISQIFDILVSNPEVFSKTILIVNYDEADGSFDHIVPPTPPQTPAYGASTVNIENEIVTTSTPKGPIGLGTRVPFIAISPWSKGGYVNSQVFDHTSVVQFIEKRFGVFERNISPWRRAVAGDLTSVFNFANPNDAPAPRCRAPTRICRRWPNSLAVTSTPSSPL